VPRSPSSDETCRRALCVRPALRAICVIVAAAAVGGCGADPDVEAVAWARAVRPLVADRALVAEQRMLREAADVMSCRQFNAAAEARIPYSGLMDYPENWPEICAARAAPPR